MEWWRWAYIGLVVAWGVLTIGWMIAGFVLQRGPLFGRR